MNRRLAVYIAVVVAVVLGVGAAIWWQRPTAPEGNLSGTAVGGPFTLVDELGETVDQDSYAGKWRLMYFGYTYCPDICPTDTAKMAQALTLLEAEHPGALARVAPLFVTVDPERDTPAVLAEFTDHFHPAIIGLTGSRAQIDAMLKTFRIFAQKVPGVTEGSYTLDHLAVFYLMDPENRPVAFLASQTATPRDIADLLARYLT